MQYNINVNQSKENFMAYIIDKEKCVGCGACVGACPVGAIAPDADGKMVIDQEKCISCGTCAAVCPVDAPVSE